MLAHGGRLRAAARRYGIPLSDWLDLSTGIAPFHLALPDISPAAWLRLPEPDDELVPAARRFYDAPGLLPVAGSQMAIQALPRLRPKGEVGIVSPCYGEHALAWRREGHRLWEVSEGGVTRTLNRLDVLVVVNPNNPTGRLIETSRLLDWHAQLAERGGWLVVDEAFIDCWPQASLAAHTDRPGLIVLRSFGKFFGMAGARLGFVLAEAELLSRLDSVLGPWTVNGPTRQLAALQLADEEGQQVQRRRLLDAGERLGERLAAHGLPPTGGAPGFQWVACDEAVALHEFLAMNGILARLFRRPASLRFGLPPDEAGWTRLDRALQLYRMRGE